MHLYLANKLYSSWSMRPWLIMRHAGLTFDETVVPLRQPDTKERILEVSPSGKLPCLHLDNGSVIWDSLAIISSLSDLKPEAAIWPQGAQARAHAKSVSCEMHSSFQALRSACPMNLGKVFERKDLGADVAADVARIETIWRETRAQFASDGPYLYGNFSAADAMYAPVVNRLAAYQFEVADDTRAYMDAVENDAHFQAWRADALKEPWDIPAYEEGWVVIETYR